MKNNSEKKSPKSVSKSKTSVKTTKTGKTGKIGGWITFLKEVRSEMRKVNWPPRKEIVGSTSALIIATFFVGIFLGAVDLVLAEGVRPALSGSPTTMSYVTLGLFSADISWVFTSN